MSLEIPMTELEAVNAILGDIGERPVNSLVGVSSRLDVTRAQSSLNQVSRAVQQRGWWFNRERIELTVDGSGYYNIPANCVRVEVESGGPTTGQYSKTPYLVVRGSKLYDTANQTDVFTGADTVVLIIHRLLDYEDLPSIVREYIYATASVRNQSRALGSQHVSAELRDQAQVAMGLMQLEDVDSQNIDLTTGPRFFRIMQDS